MDARHLQDRVHWGMNRAANILGHITDAYRPSGTSNPLNRSNRYLRLPAVFSRVDGNFDRSIGYGVGVWRGYFDASYTRVGDYLVQDSEVWFIAEQQSLLPVLCVKANRVISVSRHTAPIVGTANVPTPSNAMFDVISGWPVSQLGTGTEGRSQARLPGDTAIPNWITLVPSIHGQIFQPSDIVTDDLGTNGIVVATELSNLGWRLNVRQVTT
jgi:hypothetical protein